MKRPDAERDGRERGEFLARVLGEGESPGWWGIPVGRVGGCPVRIHLVALVYVPAQLLYALWSAQGVPFVLLGIAALAAVVGVHEVARGVTLRRAGLLPEDVTLWPLGGVWRLRGEAAAPSDEGRGAIVGLAAVVVLMLVLAGAVYLATGRGTDVLFNPLRPGVVLGGLQGGSTFLTLSLVLLWQLYAMSVYVAAANLLPMPPLDGGLALRAWMARRAAARDATARSARIGLVVAAALVVAGLVTRLSLVMAIGICGGIVCWFEWQSGRFVLDPAGVDRWRDVIDRGESASDAPPITAEDREAVEKILEKISASGMESLSGEERRTLRRATAKLRGG